MRKCGLLLLVTVLAIQCSGQGENNIWAFGQNAGLDFNSGSPVAIKTAIIGDEGTATISDANGQLLFYTEGSTIWDRSHNVMPNGFNLTGLTPRQDVNPTVSTSQGALIIPIPDTLGKYYVFSISSWEYGENTGRFYYSVVDMSLNGGLGDVVPDRKGILIDSGLTEKLDATLGDRCNIWLLVQSSGTAAFKAYEITENGINLSPVISSNSFFPGVFGVMKISPNRRKLAVTGGLQLFDFDPLTGVVSNGVMLENYSSGYYGVCFSPDNTKLYGKYKTDLAQFDLSAPDPASTKIILGNSYSQSDLRIGPDNKIYCNAPNAVVNGETINPSNFLAAIELPNLAGTACHVNKNAVRLDEKAMFILGITSPSVKLIRDTADFTSRDIKVCFEDNTTLIADSSGWDYYWEGGAVGRALTVHASGDYVVHYRTPPCVFHSDTFRVDFASRIPNTGAYAGCKGENNTYVWVYPGAGDTSKYIYTWRDSSGNLLRTSAAISSDTLFNVTAGLDAVSMQALNGCDTSFDVRLSVPNYQASFATDTIICVGESTSFENTSSGFVSYLWHFGDGDTSDLPNPAHIYTQPGLYNALLVGYPCADTAKTVVTVDSTPFIKFVSERISSCVGNAVNFYPSYPFRIDTLFWDFGDGNSNVLDFMPVHAYDSPGRWVVKVTASFRACPDVSFSDTIVINAMPVVILGPDTAMCPGVEAITLRNLRNADPVNYRYRWNTGDTTTSSLARHPGLYTLTVTSDEGCATTDSLEIAKSCYLDIPNAFTPNGDGNNDYFIPRPVLGRQLSGFSMMIYNRWGQLVFQTDKIDGRGWDGKLANFDQPEGVFIYLITATTSNHSEQYKGNVTLIR